VDQEESRRTTLRERGVVLVSTPLPWAQAGAINSYLLIGPPHTLVDPGWYEGWSPMVEAFRQEGVDPAEIGAVLVTHGHPDHCSMLEPLLGAASPEVHLHPDERSKIAPDFVDYKCGQYRRARSFFLEEGVPEAVYERFVGRFSAETRHRFERAIGTEPLTDGQVLELPTGSLHIVATPGHTPGHVMIEDRQRGLMFSGDHLMARISPNPVLDFLPDDSRYRGMPEYLDSIERIRGRTPDLWCGGHGPVFRDAARRIDSLLVFLQRRQRRILEGLEQGPATSFAIARRLFPGASGLDVFLSFSVVVGHLNELLDRGSISEEHRDGRRWLQRT